MKIRITWLSVRGISSCQVNYEPCCEMMGFALKHSYIDAEWSESEGGFKLRQNPELLSQDMDITPYKEHPQKTDELSVNFCPFCGEKLEWQIS